MQVIYKIERETHVENLEEAWKKLKEDLKQEQPFKFMYEKSIDFLDWLEKILD